MTWGYSELHPGASGGTTGPDAFNQLVGAMHRNAGDEWIRNAYAQDPGRGLAASLPAEVASVLSSDRPHEPLLDGHRDSAIAHHPDGQFARNTAVTSDHSRSANYETFRTVLTGWDQTVVDERGYAQQPLENPSQPTRTVRIASLFKGRADRLIGIDHPELITKDAEFGVTRLKSFLSREWTGTELALAAVGVYATYSALA